MKDVEFEVYTELVNLLRSRFPEIIVSADYNKSSSRFPYVSIRQVDAPLLLERQDSSGGVNFWRVTFTVEVYSNNQSTKRAECKTIAGAIDDWFVAHNFDRLSLTPVENMQDATIYRLVGRYQATTDGETFYSRRYR